MHPKHAPVTPPPPTPSPLDLGQLSPGGDDLPAYRWAFNVFVILFLLLVCFGLANYLGWYAKAHWGG